MTPKRPLSGRTHGLISKNLVPRTKEEESEFAAIRDSSYGDYNPEGHTETLLVDRIVHARCSLVRVTRLLGELESGTRDDVEDPAKAKAGETLRRYCKRFEDSLYRAIRMLQREQTERAIREAMVQPSLAENLPPMANVAQVLRTFKARKRTADEAAKRALAAAKPITSRVQ